ncbi:MAG: hypothetical protein JWQ23_1625 [Herminiimonas sp.]|jgi:GntR family carbon starvation induced transcriptional regulator|nr:hypothetical protein [Herminiimonas sp.]
MDESKSLPTGSRATLASSLTAQLRLQIMRGEIAPGSKLRLEELRDTYGVSLSPLRESLSRLGAEGLVIIEDQRGYRVAPVSRANLEEVTRLRIELESLALRESIRLGDDRWEESLVASFHTLQKIEKLRHLPEKMEEWERAHHSFHVALLGACGMPLLLQFCSTLQDLSDRYRRIYLQQGRRPPERDISAEHRSVMEAALARDEEKSIRYLRENIERTGAYILSILDDDL